MALSTIQGDQAMSRGSKAKHQTPKRVQLREPSQEELEDIERDVDDEMFGPEDAEYFRLAGIDDIGRK